MFDEVAALRPLKDAANSLALKSDWDRLYDKSVLQNNTVKVASATYFDDLYVDFNLAQARALLDSGVIVCP